MRIRVDLIAALGVLLALTALGISMIRWAAQWRKAAQNPPVADNAPDSYRALVESGEISSEEYERICQHLANPANSSPPRETAE